MEDTWLFTSNRLISDGRLGVHFCGPSGDTEKLFGDPWAVAPVGQFIVNNMLLLSCMMKQIVYLRKGLEKLVLLSGFG